MPYTWLYYIMSNLLPNKNCQIMLIYQMAKIDRYPLLKSSSSTEQNNKKLTHLEPSFHNLFVLNTVYTDIYLKQTRSWATGARVFIEKWTFTFTVHLWLCCWILIRFLSKNSMRSLFYIYLYIINRVLHVDFTVYNNSIS